MSVFKTEEIDISNYHFGNQHFIKLSTFKFNPKFINTLRLAQ